ncbi:hypothetical protein ACFE04_015540 [Oxalis oulophora]
MKVWFYYFLIVGLGLNFFVQVDVTSAQLLSVILIFNENDAISTRRASYEDCSGIFLDNDKLAALLALELNVDMLSRVGRGGMTAKVKAVVSAAYAGILLS